MKVQGHNGFETVDHQDDKSAMSSENNGKSSSGNRTKHVNVKCHFVKDCIERKEFGIELCGTDDMWSDFQTKPLQGKKFEEFGKMIMNSEDWKMNEPLTVQWMQFKKSNENDMHVKQ